MLTADEALARLIEGNRRFRAAAARPFAFRAETMADLARGQQPFATILGCSDSRVPPELIFDAAMGELFVVRVAGNVLSAEVMGSFQYAAMHLRTQLFVVLGHQGCGAVQAALARKLTGARERTRIERLLDSITPGIDGIDGGIPEPDRLERAVEANVRWAMRQIMDTPEAQARRVEGRLKLVGAVYEIATGRVRFLEPPTGAE